MELCGSKTRTPVCSTVGCHYKAITTLAADIDNYSDVNTPSKYGVRTYMFDKFGFNLRKEESRSNFYFRFIVLGIEIIILSD